MAQGLDTCGEFEGGRGERRRIENRLDLLACRAEMLTGRDRTLMQMYLKNGNSFRQMARLMGVNEATVARKIHKVTRRLLDGEYITCLRNRQRLTAEQMEIAKDYLVRGLSLRNIAREHGCSLHSVRKAMKKVEEVVRVANGS